MPVDAWLPVGYSLPDGARTRLALQVGVDWQIVETSDNGRALIVTPGLVKRWDETRLVDQGLWQPLKFGDASMYAFTSPKNSMVVRVADSRSPQNKSEALAFAASLRETRLIDRNAPLQDCIYVEALSRLLPTYALSPPVADDVLLGTWLTGGVPLSVHSDRRVRQLLSWLSEAQISEIIKQSGLAGRILESGSPADTVPVVKIFTLSGRPALEQFFKEHVIDLIEHADRYRALGIDFPSATILHGPPGCGKTFAVEQLIDYLGWPSFSIDASSIGSPYIHETSRKVAEVFDKAIKEAPSVLVIDEMEAFLADREMGSGSSHHRVEEVGEFLRRIPEAIKNRVLIIAMTNRLEMIDPAIQRRGRFDHVINVGMPSKTEVEGLLSALLSHLPVEELDIPALATGLAGRPLSDVAFVVREGARLAARSGRVSVDQASLTSAMRSAAARGEKEAPRKIGFT
jgi:Cdc6-like AAA superfamily ATPase